MTVDPNKVSTTREELEMGELISLKDGTHAWIATAAVRTALGRLMGQQMFFIEVRSEDGGVLHVPLGREMALGLSLSLKSLERRAVADGFLPEEH